MKTSLTLTISLCFAFCFVFCAADVLAVQYLKMVVTEEHGPVHTNAQLAEIYFFDQKGKEILPNTIKIFAPECAGEGGSDGYNWDHTHGETFKFANALDRDTNTFFVITNNAHGGDKGDEITENDPVPIVFEFHAGGIQQITKIEWLPRQPGGDNAVKRFHLEISSDGESWTRVGDEYEDDKPRGGDKRTFEELKISLATAVEPISELAATWASIKKQ